MHAAIQDMERECTAQKKGEHSVQGVLFYEMLTEVKITRKVSPEEAYRNGAKGVCLG